MMLKKKFILILINPVFLVFVGSIIGLLPAIYYNNTFLGNYIFFKSTNQIYYVYVIGFFSFTLGMFFSYFLYRSKTRVYRHSVPRYKLIFLIILVLAAVLIANIRSYGGIPLLMIFRGVDINYVNSVQSEQSSGIFGLEAMLVYALIVLFQPIIVNYKNVKYKLIFWVQLIILLFATTYSGKRQFIFIFSTTVLSYMLNYTLLNGNKLDVKRMKRRIIITSVVVSIFFSIVGLVRIESDISIGNFIKPLILYASLPYMNLSNIILLSNDNSLKFTFQALIDTLLSGMPYRFRPISTSLQDIPLIESTSPCTIYGEIFWNFQYPGVIIFMFIIGIVIGRIYKKAISNRRIFMSTYSLCVWPLMSIHTYNHFLNVMYLLIPASLVILLEIRISHKKTDTREGMFSDPKYNATRKL